MIRSGALESFLPRIDFQGLSRKTCANRFFEHFEHNNVLLDACILLGQINTRLFRCGIVVDIFLWSQNDGKENDLLLTVAKA